MQCLFNTACAVLLITVLSFLQAPLFKRFSPETDAAIFNLLVPKKQSSGSINNAATGILFCTMLSDDFQNYAQGSLRLIQALRMEYPGMDSAVLELSEKRIPPAVWDSLQSAGWDSLITLPRIPPRHEGMEFNYRFRDQFSKVHLWNLTAYRWVLYMDSDIMILRSMRPLVSHILGNCSSFWAVEDLPAFPGSFNAGLMALRPSAQEYSRLLDLLHNESLPFAEEWAEQGFLNSVYENSWGKLPLTMALSLSFWWSDMDAWNSLSRDAHAIHFNMIKPWNWWCPWTTYSPLCFLFWNKQHLQFHAVIASATQ